jgi:pimeloyl-ACP methyl ester carboxylesterase
VTTMPRTGFDAEYPFESHFLNLPVPGASDVRMHYVDEGPSAAEGGNHGPMLFVHGNPTWSFAWRNFIKAFSPQRRVLAIDHIGCGFSDKPQEYPYRLGQHIENLCQFIRTLDLQRITLGVHDWGGAIGLGAAARMPDRFERLVVFNTAAFRSRRMPWRIAVCRWPLVGPLGVRGGNLFARAALTMAVQKHDRMTPEVCAGYLAPYGNWHNRVAIQRFVEDIPLSPRHPSYADLLAVEDGLPRLSGKPMLLIWGERDWCFTPHFLAEFERRFPAAEVLRLADAGHYVFEDAHEVIIPRVQQFLSAIVA